VNIGCSQHSLDGSDLSHLASDLSKACGVSKSDDEESPEVILRWFGISRTGETAVIGPNGETGPEYAITDLQQNARAIQDPYGYRSSIDAGPSIPWTAAKELFR
jgi:hypothetical protein